MTVCIAALADNGKSAVICSDKMKTRNVGGMTFQDDDDEHRKIFSLPNGTFVLTAGDESYASDAINAALPLIDATTTFEQAAEHIRGAFAKRRIEIIVQEHITNRGIGTLDDYFQKHISLPQTITAAIDNAFMQCNVGQTEFLIVGKDASDIFHVWRITQLATIYRHDETGFCCMGSGAVNAMTVMMEPEYKKNLSVARVHSIVERAKRASEIVAGVGKKTDIVDLPIVSDETVQELVQSVVSARQTPSDPAGEQHA